MAHHDGVAPIISDKPNHPWAHTMPFQNQNAPSPIHCIEGFLEVRKTPQKFWISRYKSCWANLASMTVVPIPWCARHPCRVSCNTMESSHKSIIRSSTFQIGSSKLIPRKSPPPFGIKTTMIQSSWRVMMPWDQTAWTNWTNSCQLSPPMDSLACWGSPHPGFWRATP
jgi:hypothetical protein